MLKKVSIILALSLTLGLAQTVKFPYPQRKLYGNSTINATSCTASEDLKSIFLDFMKGFYEEGKCGSADCARIKFDDKNYTVSEGIGYGMLMMVYFSDNTTSYQTQFDKLWTYYKHWSQSSPGNLMHWKISGFNSVNQTGAASDAEFDVALALAMARYQFDDTKYETDAKNLIAKIRQYEIDPSNNLHYPGDAWQNGPKNPSYVSPAAFEIFRGLDGSTNNNFWNNVISANYKLLTDNQGKSSAKLPSDWCDASGTAVNGNNTYVAYDMDASRAPWRWAWSNAWYGGSTAHASAKTLLNNLVPYVNGKAPAEIKGPINMDGTPRTGSYNNSTYVGSLMTALTVGSTYQDRLNQYWVNLKIKGGEPYFNHAIQVLTGLLVTGNMPNLQACSNAGTGCGTTMPSTGCGDGASVQIDKLNDAEYDSEEDRNFARTWEPWFAYTDINNMTEGVHTPGASTIQNASRPSKDENDNCKNITSYTVVMKDGNEWVAKIDRYSLSKGQNPHDPYVALSLATRKNQIDYDLSKCTGVSYEFRGEAHYFRVEMSTVKNSAYHQTKISPAANAWTKKTIPFSDIAQPSWNPSTAVVAFDSKKVEAFTWELKGDGTSATAGSLAVKNFRCIGDMTMQSSKPASKCNVGGNSSNSGGGTSSNSGGGTSSNSGGGTSSNSGGGNSSGSGYGGGNSSGSVSPIILSSVVANNGLNAMQNAVNLAVTGNAVVQIFDLKGNAIRTQSFTQGSYVVQMADLPRGLYIVKASSGNWKQTISVPIK